MALILGNDERDYAIKPEASAPSLDTSTWPLLLKGYDKRKVGQKPVDPVVYLMW